MVDHRRDLRGCLRLHARQEVDVLFERERRRLVAEPFGHDLDRDAGLEREARARVSLMQNSA